MRSQRSQILAMLFSRRIGPAEAERLLAVVWGRDRFFFLALGTVFVLAAGSANPALYHLGQSVASALHASQLPIAALSMAFRKVSIACVPAIVVS